MNFRPRYISDQIRFFRYEKLFKKSKEKYSLTIAPILQFPAGGVIILQMKKHITIWRTWWITADIHFIFGAAAFAALIFLFAIGIHYFFEPIIIFACVGKIYNFLMSSNANKLRLFVGSFSTFRGM